MIDEAMVKDNIFIIKRSDIEGRIDPQPYHRERRETLKKLKQLSKLEKLKNVVSFDKKIITELKSDHIYIGLENIKSNTGEYVKTTAKKSISSAAVFKKGQILFPKLRPYLNKVHLAQFDGICSTEFHILECKPGYLNEFLAIYLRSDLIVNQTKHLMTGNTLPRLQTSDIENLPVPIIEINRQNQIISLYNNAFDQKLYKEEQAKELLDGIDSYLLNELGITIPEKDNSLENRIFTTKFSEISGSRFDPLPYDERTKALKKAILNVDTNKFKIIRLNDYILQSLAGDWGIDSSEELEKYKRCLVIRATEFDNDFNLNLDASRVKYRSIKSEKLRKLDIQASDILIEKSGGSIDQPVGRVAIISQEHIQQHKLCYSNFIHKIRVDANYLNPYYIFSFLKMTHNSKLTESMQSQTNGIRNLIMSNFLGQNIVVPINQDGSIDLYRQEEIGFQLNQMRNQAFTLLEEGESILHQAEKRVEEIILKE